jgi:hypothetical protein
VDGLRHADPVSQKAAQLFAHHDEFRDVARGEIEEPFLRRAEFAVARGERAVVDVLVPLEAEQPLGGEPEGQQNPVRVFEMKVRGVEYARAARLRHQRGHDAEPAVADKAYERVATLAVAEHRPDARDPAAQVLREEAHVN